MDQNHQSHRQDDFKLLLAGCERAADDELLQGEQLNLTPEQRAAAQERAQQFYEQATTDQLTKLSR